MSVETKCEVKIYSRNVKKVCFKCLDMTDEI